MGIPRCWNCLSFSPQLLPSLLHLNTVQFHTSTFSFLYSKLDIILFPWENGWYQVLAQEKQVSLEHIVPDSKEVLKYWWCIKRTQHPCMLCRSAMSDSLQPYQAPVSIGLSRQEYWSGLPFPPGDLPDPRMEPTSSASPALADRFFTTEPPGKPKRTQSESYSVVFNSLRPHGLYLESSRSEYWSG